MRVGLPDASCGFEPSLTSRRFWLDRPKSTRIRTSCGKCGQRKPRIGRRTGLSGGREDGSRYEARPHLDVVAGLTQVTNRSVSEKPPRRRLPSMRVVPINTRRGGSLQ
jgi:hypothetical protein